MPDFSYDCDVPVAPERVWRWLTSPGALVRLIPSYSGIRVLRADQVSAGAIAELSIPVAPGLRLRWVAQHRLDSVWSFIDQQQAGPFASWDHRHSVTATATGARVSDRIDWTSPVSWLIGGQIQRQCKRDFAWRARRMNADLATPEPRPQRIALSGAGGLVGAALSARLTTLGHTVLPLQRRPGSQPGIAWDPRRGTIDRAALASCDTVIHLAGESVAQAWSPAVRHEIMASRVVSTRVLAETMAALQPQGGPRNLVVASGILVGRDPEVAASETEVSGDGFLSTVIAAWEHAADPARAAGLRVAHIRCGMVLDPRGGALAKMLPAFRLGLGGPIGDGQQWQSWISLDDVVEVFAAAVSDQRYAGPIHAVAPQAIRQRDFAANLGKCFGRPAFLPAPLPLLRLAYGRDMVAETILASHNLRPARLHDLGFSWRFPELAGALAWLLGRASSP